MQCRHSYFWGFVDVLGGKSQENNVIVIIRQIHIYIYPPLADSLGILLRSMPTRKRICNVKLENIMKMVARPSFANLLLLIRRQKTPAIVF